MLKYAFIDDNEILAELAKQFLACFTYSLPEIYDINLNQFSDNDFKKDENNDKFYFIRHQPKAEFINIEKEKIEFWLSSTDSECSKLIKKKFFETQNEIRTMYPKLIEDDDSICFKCFMDYVFSEKDYNDITQLTRILAVFKIRCWEMADENAGSNKFFS